MKHAKLFSVVVVAALSIYAIAGFYFLPLASFEGGLTRMSQLPESQFGWTKPQPAIAPELFRQAEWQEADVLVVGDSFSMEHLWQTVLTQHGLRVRTETWQNIRDICEDFTPWLKSQGFKGRHIIIEIIERNTEDVINRSLGCKNMSYHSVHYPPAGPPQVLPDRQHADYSGKLSVGIRTQLHALEYSYLSKDSNFRHWDLPNNVRMDRLPDGCDLFSHPRCQDVLFLAGDRIQDFNETMLAKMSSINSRLNGVTPVWVIVPDKSTAYLNPNKQFWNQAASRFQSPNLLETFRLAIGNKAVDLYRGNDTHLSTEGYLIMGEAIRQSMAHP